MASARAQRLNNRSNNSVHITSQNDRRPEVSILELLKAHKGKHVRLVVYRGGRARKWGIIKEGSYRGQRYQLQRTYQLPNTDKEINTMFRGKHHEGLYWHYKMRSDCPNSYHLQIGDQIRVFPVHPVTPRRHRQRYRSGITHCLFEPMKNWGLAKYGDAKSKESRSHYKRFVETCDELAERYEEGVPDADIQSVARELSKHSPVRITVSLPLQGGVVTDSGTLGKAFHFTNTRWDHVNINAVTSATPTPKRIEELEAMMNDLDQRAEWYTYRKGLKGITSVQTLHGTYCVQNEYVEAVKSFEEQTGLASLKIDAIGQPALSRFVQSSMHYNLPGLRPRALPPLIQAMVDAVQVSSEAIKAAHAAAAVEYISIDIAKSYASFWKCRLYEGFPSKLTQLRRCSEMQGPGVYYISDLDWSGANERFVEACELLGQPYRDDNVYPKPDLVLMREQGVTFTVLAGAWAGGMKPRFDFRFPDEWLSNVDENGVKWYCRWEGACNSISTTTSYWLKGTKEWAACVAGGQK